MCVWVCKWQKGKENILVVGCQCHTAPIPTPAHPQCAGLQRHGWEAGCVSSHARGHQKCVHPVSRCRIVSARWCSVRNRAVILKLALAGFGTIVSDDVFVRGAFG